MTIGVANQLTAARIDGYRLGLAAARLTKNAIAWLIIIAIVIRRTVSARAVGIIWIAALGRIIIVGVVVAFLCAVIIFWIGPRLAEGELVLEFI